MLHHIPKQPGIQKKSKAGPSQPSSPHIPARRRSKPGPSHSPTPSEPTTLYAPAPLGSPKIANLRDLYETVKTDPPEIPSPVAATTPRTPLKCNTGKHCNQNNEITSTVPRPAVRSNTENGASHRDLKKIYNTSNSRTPVRSNTGPIETHRSLRKNSNSAAPRTPARGNTSTIGAHRDLNKNRSRKRSKSPKRSRTTSPRRNPANSGNIRDLNKSSENRRSESPKTSRPATPGTQERNAVTNNNIINNDNVGNQISSNKCKVKPSASSVPPSAHVVENRAASPEGSKKGDRDSLKRKLEVIDDDLRKKNKLIHGKEGKEMMDRAVTEVETEDEDSKLIELGAETSDGALMRESVKAIQEAKERGLYDDYISPDRVVRVPRSSWLMMPKPNKNKKAGVNSPDKDDGSLKRTLSEVLLLKSKKNKGATNSPDKDDGSLKRTLSEVLLLKPKKNKCANTGGDEEDGEEQEPVRRTLSEAVRCRVQDRRKRNELAASVKASLEDGLKNRRLDELQAQVDAYAEKMGVQIRKAEVQDELYEIQKAKMAAQSQEICKLKGKLAAANRTTEAVKLEQVKLKKEVEDTKQEIEALKTLVGRIFVENSMKNM